MAKEKFKFSNLPIISHLKQSVGLQRVMLLIGLILCAIFILVAVFARFLAPYNYNQISDEAGLFGSLLPPFSPGHIFGTTVGGFDVLSRVIWGAQTAAVAIVLAVVFSLFLGVLLGLVSGFVGGIVDRILVVIADAIYSFPSLLLAILMAIAISKGESSFWGGIIASGMSITVIFIPQYFRVIRVEAARIKSELYVDAAKVIGVSTPKILFRHILKNSTRTLPVIFTLNSSEAILTLAGLGFLGFGIEPTAAAEWGYDLNRAMGDVTSGIWWTAIFPGIAIILVVLGVTLVGESLNDLSDPRLRERKATGNVIKRNAKVSKAEDSNE